VVEGYWGLSRFDHITKKRSFVHDESQMSHFMDTGIGFAGHLTQV
jgi:hypothetical protein